MPKQQLVSTPVVEDEETELEHIARLVREGFTSGIQPTWSIELGDDATGDDDALEIIAEGIERGFNRGYGPHWSLRRERSD